MLQISSVQQAGNASRPPSVTPGSLLKDLEQERIATITQDLHDGRLLKLDDESVQKIKAVADPKTQKGGYGDVYFSKYLNIVYLYV